MKDYSGAVAYPEEIFQSSVDTGIKKVKKSLVSKSLLGFLGGAYVALAYLAVMRATASITSLGSISNFIGSLIFPVGLVMALVCGGEVATGNMMAVSSACFAKKVSWFDFVKNQIVITLSNCVGALTVAFFFGYFIKLLMVAPYSDIAMSIAESKLHYAPLEAFVSGIGCNWLVALAVWMGLSAKTDVGKILGIYIPTMTFVAIGFQHSVANMFVLGMSTLAGHTSWLDFISNISAVYLGNVVGGVLFVSGIYYYALKDGLKKEVKD